MPPECGNPGLDLAELSVNVVNEYGDCQSISHPLSPVNSRHEAGGPTAIAVQVTVTTDQAMGVRTGAAHRRDARAVCSVDTGDGDSHEVNVGGSQVHRWPIESDSPPGALLV